MTSTSFNVGLNDNPRLSSRVLRPPGGGHTDIFGGEPEPPRTGRRMNNQATVAVAAAAEPPRTGRRMNNPTAVAAAAAAEEAAKATSTEIPEQNGQNEARQVEIAPAEPVPAATKPAVTEPVSNDAPEAAAAPAPIEQAKVEAILPETQSTRRARVPPGGFSSGLW